jgi:hypothetical protein
MSEADAPTVTKPPAKTDGLITKVSAALDRPFLAAEGEPAYNRFKRMEATWLALAEEQDWLDGEQLPVATDEGLKASPRADLVTNQSPIRESACAILSVGENSHGSIDVSGDVATRAGRSANVDAGSARPI